MLFYVTVVFSLCISYVRSNTGNAVESSVENNTDMEGNEDSFYTDDDDDEDSFMNDKDYDAYIYPNETNANPIVFQGAGSPVSLKDIINGVSTMKHSNGSIIRLSSQNDQSVTVNDENATTFKLSEVNGDEISLKSSNGTVVKLSEKNSSLLTVSSSGRLLLKLPTGYHCSHCQPEQVHIAFGGRLTTVVVMWVTYNNTEKSMVKYGVHYLDGIASGSSRKFKGNRKHGLVRYIHTVKIKKLTHGVRYKYHCGSEYGWSELFSFQIPPKGHEYPVKALVYGDMGNRNPHALASLQLEAAKNHYDMVMHIGDFAYNLNSKDGLVGDQFMRQIQPIAANLPYMTCPGNHETSHHYHHYRRRFKMPSRNKMYFSFNIGLIHVISINTEVYFDKKSAVADIITQYHWLVKDLIEATKKRHKRPWIVIMGHRPMYCSNIDADKRCNLENPLRVGTKKTKRGYGCYGLEPLMNKFGVDVVFWGHEHSYERLYPVFDWKVYKSAGPNPYLNPQAPVHIITGSAGCWEKIKPFMKQRPAWSAFRSEEYGYMKMMVPNRTHMHLIQVAELEVELGNINWHIVGLSGVRREDEAGNLLYHHQFQGGVGFHVNKALENNVVDISSVSNRVAYLVLKLTKRYSLKEVQYSVDRNNQPIDDIWIVKNNFKHHLRGYGL